MVPYIKANLITNLFSCSKYLSTMLWANAVLWLYGQNGGQVSKAKYETALRDYIRHTLKSNQRDAALLSDS